MTLSAGIHAGVAMAEYLGQPCAGPAVQATDLRRLWDECPALAWELWSGNPTHIADADTPAQEFGEAFHMLLLEPERFASRYVVKPEGMNFSTKEGKAWRAAQEGAGVDILTTDAAARMTAMRDKIAAHPMGMAILNRQARAEMTLIARDPETGLWLKSRPDFLMTDPPALCVNLKTAARPNPRHWARQAADLGYHISAAMTRRIARLIGLDAALPYAFLVVGSTPPHLPFVGALKETAMQWGDLIVASALRRFAECLASSRWPGYADEVAEIDLPAWEEARLTRLHAAGAFQAPLTPAA